MSNTPETSLPDYLREDILLHPENRKFPPFDLVRLLGTVFAPTQGCRVCILLDFEEPAQLIQDFAFLQHEGFPVQKNAHRHFYLGLHHGAMAALGMGLFLSTISKTMQEAFMSNFLIFMPMILLSGFMFPVSSMPRAFQWITLLNPVRHYLVVVRGIFLKGAGIGVLWPELIALFVMGIAIQAFAATRFHKTAG